LVVLPVAGGVPRRNVRADQPGLALVDACEGVVQVDLVRPDRLDLRSEQHDAGLHRVVDGELVASAPVDGDRLFGNWTAPWREAYLRWALRGSRRSSATPSARGRKNAGPEGPAFNCSSPRSR